MTEAPTDPPLLTVIDLILLVGLFHKEDTIDYLVFLYGQHDPILPASTELDSRVGGPSLVFDSLLPRQTESPALVDVR